MKKLLIGLMAAGFFAVILLTGGCKLGTSTPSYTEFAIQVDSIQYPDTVAYGTTLKIKFYGTIGPSTCYSFSRFTGGVNGQQIDIAALGKYANNDSNCATGVQYLNGDTLGVNLINSGTFVIHVMQPTPPDIYDTVYITPRIPSVR